MSTYHPISGSYRFYRHEFLPRNQGVQDPRYFQISDRLYGRIFRSYIFNILSMYRQRDVIEYDLPIKKLSKIVLSTLIYEYQTVSSLVGNFEFLKMAEHVIIAQIDQQKRQPTESVIMTSPHTQTYRYHRETISIIRPQIGTVLRRTPKKIRRAEMFVVIETSVKHRGNNKGIIDLVKLEPIGKVADGFVEYRRTNYPLVMKLSNHGEWWTKRLLTEFEYEWIVDLQRVPHDFDGKSSPKLTMTNSIPCPIVQGNGADPIDLPRNSRGSDNPVLLGRSWDSAHHHPKTTIEGWAPPQVQRPRRWTLDPIAIPTVDMIQQSEPGLPFVLELDESIQTTENPKDEHQSEASDESNFRSTGLKLHIGATKDLQHRQRTKFAVSNLEFPKTSVGSQGSVPQGGNSLASESPKAPLQRNFALQSSVGIEPGVPIRRELPDEVELRQASIEDRQHLEQPSVRRHPVLSVQVQEIDGLKVIKPVKTPPILVKVVRPF